MAAKPRVPSRYKKPAASIATREMDYREARAVLKAGNRIPRGTRITGYPQMPETSLRHLRIRFMKDGSVREPRYEEISEGVLGTARFDTVRDASAAIRKEWHTQQSVLREMGQIDRAFAQLQGLHNEVLHDWNSFNAKQKKAAHDYAIALAGSISKQPKRLREGSPKRQAVEQLLSAADSIESNKPVPSLLKMVASANRLVTRKNALLRQSVFVPRREKTIARAKYREDAQMYGMLDVIIRTSNVLGSAKPADITPHVNNLMAFSRRAIARREQQLKQMGELAAKAARDLGRRRYKEAVIKIRKVQKDMFILASESTILFPERLDWVERHRDLPYKTRIVRNQLGFFEANMEYYLSKVSRPEQRTNMAQYLDKLADIMKRAKSPTVETAIREAAELFRVREIAECRASLSNIVAGM